MVTPCAFPPPPFPLLTLFAKLKNPPREELNAALQGSFRSGRLQSISATAEEPLVSMDYKGDPAPRSLMPSSTMALGGNMVKVVTWYDNEWGYSCRTGDLAAMMAKSL